MQALLASLVFSMSVKDDAFRSAMEANRNEVKRTERQFDDSGQGMVAAMRDTAEGVNRAVISMVDGLHRAVDSVKRAGAAMTVGLTVPLGLMAHASKDAASDFQSAMNKVKSAVLTASPEDLNKLRDAALELGPAMGRSAVEAAGAIEALAKNGMSASAILGGGLKSALTLATVGETDLAKAADLTTDIMAQFNKTSSELPAVVNAVVGALDASKMGFDDYRLAAGQAGGVTGALGYTFEDFNTGLAATAPLFDSGASAGTSYRAFLTSLVAKSKDAEAAMKQLGLSFYNADGGAKSLAEIADQLQKKMGNLSDKSKLDFLNPMFGTDGAQTAVKLIQLGAKGIEDARAQIDAVTADDKVKVLLDGEAAATQRLAAAWERLKIGIGEAGLIQVATAIKNAMAMMIETIAKAPPPVFYFINAIGALASAVGPIVFVMAAAASAIAPLLLSTTMLGTGIGRLAIVMAALVNPTGLIVGLLGRLAVNAGAGLVIAKLGAGMLRFAGPIGLLTTALSILLPLLMQNRQAAAQYTNALDTAKTATSSSVEIALKLANAHGKARVEALALARADRERSVEALRAARSDLAAARAASARARAQSSSLVQKAYETVSFGSSDWEKSIDKKVAGFFGVEIAPNRMDAALNQQKAAETLGETLKRFDSIDAAINAAEVPENLNNLAFDDGTKKREKKGRDAARDEAMYLDELGRARVELLRSQADLTDSARARYAADMAAIAEDRASYARQLDLDKGLNDAQRATLLAARDRAIGIQRQIAAQTLERELQQEGYDLARADNERQQEALRVRRDAADSISERRDIELKLLELQRRQEEADLDLILATKATASAEWDNARKRKEQLPGIYADREAEVLRGSEGPGASYLRTLTRSSAAIREDIEGARVDALKGFNQDLTDAILGTQKLGDAFANMSKRIIASIVDIAIQQNIVKPMAEALFGGGAGGSSGGGVLGFLGGLLGGRSGPNAGVTAAFGTGGAGTIPLVAGDGANGLDAIWKQIGGSFGGFRKNGGGIGANDWYVVGEEGPEIFAPGVSGTVIPNGGRGAGPRQQPAVVQLAVEEGALFRPVVRQEAGHVSVQTTRTKAKADARAQGRRLR